MLLPARRIAGVGLDVGAPEIAQLELLVENGGARQQHRTMLGDAAEGGDLDLAQVGRNLGDAR
jgi:hypothetical protein